MRFHIGNANQDDISRRASVIDELADHILDEYEDLLENPLGRSILVDCLINIAATLISTAPKNKQAEIVAHTQSRLGILVEFNNGQ